MARRKKKAPPTKKPISPRIDVDVLARARGAVVALQYEGKACSLQSLVELALIDYVKKLEKKGLKIRPMAKGILKTGHTTTTTTKG